VADGEFVAVVGPNGAGKTTFFNLLNGFQTPDGGHIRFMGRRIDGLRPSAICRAGVGRTFQVVKPFAGMSVLDNVTVGALDVGEANAWAALEMVGLSDVAGQPADALTNRQLRLMELARALAGAPRLILMDEPLAGLGAGETEDLVAVVRRLVGSGLTIVIIEHTMQAMVRLADRFLVLDHGRVLAVGAPEAVTRDPRVIEAYLGRKWMDHVAD
jgi:branched-chain amino acid transport system permease protein